jgi:hypothetical protein
VDSIIRSYRYHGVDNSVCFCLQSNISMMTNPKVDPNHQEVRRPPGGSVAECNPNSTSTGLNMVERGNKLAKTEASRYTTS